MAIGIVNNMNFIGFGVNNSFNLYVDSDLGNDSNSGKIQSLAKKTLKPILASNLKIAVNPTSTIREWFIEQKIDNIFIKGWWNNAKNSLSKISGCVITSTWSKTDGYTNVYDVVITINYTITTIPGYNPVIFEITPSTLEDQPYSSYKTINKAASLALCDSSPGTLFFSSINSTSYRMYLHTTNSDDPNVNELNYEVTNKAWLPIFNQSTNTGQNNCYENMIFYPAISSSGPKAGRNGYYKKCVFASCGLHALVTDSATLDQCVWFEGQNTNSYYIVFNGYVAPITDILLVKNGIVLITTLTYFIYSHYEDNVLNNLLTISNYRIFGGGIITGASTGFHNVIVDNVYCEGERICAGTSFVDGNFTIKNSILKLTVSGSSAGISYVSTINNCLIYGTLFNNFILGQEIKNSIINALSANATYSMGASNYHHSIIVVDGTKLMILPDDVSCLSDYNVYIYIGSSTSRAYSYQNHYDGTQWPTIFAAHKTRSGQDTNSIIMNLATPSDLSTIFVDYTNGNYTIRNDTANGLAILAVGAMMTTPPIRLPIKPSREQMVSDMLAGDLETFNLFT
jgi:hypothetical protein